MRRLLIALSAVSLLAACGDDDPANPSPSPAITLAASATAGTITRGTSGVTTVTLTRINGYSGAVSLSAEGVPAGVTVTFAPQSLTGATATSTATIAVSTTAAPGNSSLVLRASGSGVNDVTVSYALTIPTPAITVTASATATVPQGGTTSVPITIARTNGATGAVTLVADGVPANVTAVFTPTSIADGSTASTLTLTAAANASVGTSPITVRATATGVVDATAPIQFSVTAATPPGYTIAAAPGALSLVAGQQGSSALTITRTGGFTSAVTFGLEGAPAGVTGTFNPNPALANTSTLTLGTTSAVAAGTYNLTVRGSSTGLTDRTIAIALTVTSAPGIGVAVQPTTLSIAQGSNQQATVTLARLNGLTGDVAMSATGMPAGMTVGFTPATVTGNSTSATVTVGASVAAGTYNVVITGTGAGNVTGSATLPVTVTGASGFTISATNVTLAQNSTATSTLTITRFNGYPGAVQLNATGTPPNVNVQFGPNPSTGGTSTITISAAPGAVVGTYTITVNAQGPAAADQSTTFTVSVTASGGGG